MNSQLKKDSMEDKSPAEKERRANAGRQPRFY